MCYANFTNLMVFLGFLEGQNAFYTKMNESVSFDGIVVFCLVPMKKSDFNVKNL